MEIQKGPNIGAFVGLIHEAQLGSAPRAPCPEPEAGKDSCRASWPDKGLNATDRSRVRDRTKARVRARVRGRDRIRARTGAVTSPRIGLEQGLRLGQLGLQLWEGLGPVLGLVL